MRLSAFNRAHQVVRALEQCEDYGRAEGCHQQKLRACAPAGDSLEAGRSCPLRSTGQPTNTLGAPRLPTSCSLPPAGDDTPGPLSTMTSRERFAAALEHRSTDRVPVDLGDVRYRHPRVGRHRLRQRLLGRPGLPRQSHRAVPDAGGIDDELREALGIDIIGVPGRKSLSGPRPRTWKPFTLFDGTRCLVSGDFNVTPAPDGGWHMYPEGDTSVPPAATCRRRVFL